MLYNDRGSGSDSLNTREMERPRAAVSITGAISGNADISIGNVVGRRDGFVLLGAYVVYFIYIMFV